MNIFIDGITNPEVKKLMVEFFDEVDKLYYDMVSLTYEEYKIREEVIWDIRNEAMKIDGDVFLISLYALENKADELYGKDATNLGGLLYDN